MILVCVIFVVMVCVRIVIRCLSGCVRLLNVVI